MRAASKVIYFYDLMLLITVFAFGIKPEMFFEAFAVSKRFLYFYFYCSLANFACNEKQYLVITPK